MRTKRYDGKDVRKILSGMIMNNWVCGRIARQWVPEGLFDNTWANQIAGLIIKHFEQFSESPKASIQTIFQGWAAHTIVDEKVVEQMEKFIVAMSDEYIEEPPEYILRVAGDYFNKVQMEIAMKAAKEDVDRGRIEDAETALDRRKKINLGRREYHAFANDPSIFLATRDKERVKPLVFYPGDLGDFIGDSLYRGTFYSFMAPDKAGKTWWLVDLAYRALRNRNRVAFFDMGDGDVYEVSSRFQIRTMGQPERDSRVQIPQDWNEDGTVKSEEVLIEEVDAMEAFRKFRKIAKNEEAFRVSCHDNSSTSVAAIDGILQDWEEDGWRPDVVVIDYADIMAPPKGIKDPLEQIDETWKHLRRLSQKRHCLLVTATQSASSAYKKADGSLLGRADFGGRKTKLAHVNGMIGINVNSKEKDVGQARINWIVRRKGHYNERSFVRVAGSMAIGNPCIISKR